MHSESHAQATGGHSNKDSGITLEPCRNTKRQVVASAGVYLRLHWFLGFSVTRFKSRRTKRPRKKEGKFNLML